jgi:hypothetical protein
MRQPHCRARHHRQSKQQEQLMAKPAPSPPTTLDLLKQQFAALCQARDAALAEVAPLRAQRDAVLARAEAALAAELAPLDAQIAAIEAPLVSTVQQIAQIATALNGQTA